MSNISKNPSTNNLYKDALNSNNCSKSITNALIAYSGNITGRLPQFKRIVENNINDIWWGEINKPILRTDFNEIRKKALQILSSKAKLYQIDCYAGWYSDYRIKVRVVCTKPYHALFMKNMLIPSDEEFDVYDFIIYNVGENELNYDGEYPHSKIVALDLEEGEMVIFGTEYAGEMKKGVLTYMMYLMPKNRHLTLHSSANIGNEGGVTLFFGLSGTGKTTLSADPKRKLIGDDEHVWHDKGVFNIEGGCYAKCIGLNKDEEPEIYNAIKYGAVLENIVVSKETGKIDFNNNSITDNTRCAYPLNHIPNTLLPAYTDEHPKNIIFLTCDAFGVFPPIAKLTYEQAKFFFICGYTSKIPGTEMGITKPIKTFSACFGEPFLIFNPKYYGDLLVEKLNKFKPNVWLLNTGWVGGSYPEGKRISIKHTRILIDAIHNNTLNDEEFYRFPLFNFEVPKKYLDLPDIFYPQELWANKDKYKDILTNLYNDFQANYEKKTKL